MSILKAKIKETQEGDRYVGIMLPQYLYSFVVIQALAKSTTKTAIIKNILTEWCVKNSVDLDLLAKEVAERAHFEWTVLRVNYPGMTYSDFKTSLKKELSDKGLDMNLVNAIINQMEDDTN